MLPALVLLLILISIVTALIAVFIFISHIYPNDISDGTLEMRAYYLDRSKLATTPRSGIDYENMMAIRAGKLPPHMEGIPGHSYRPEIDA